MFEEHILDVEKCSVRFDFCLTSCPSVTSRTVKKKKKNITF